MQLQFTHEQIWDDDKDDLTPGDIENNNLGRENPCSHLPFLHPPIVSNSHTQTNERRHFLSITLLNRKDKFVCLFTPQLLHALHYCSLLLEWLCRNSGLAPVLNLAGPISPAWLNRPSLISPPVNIIYLLVLSDCFSPHVDACQIEQGPQFIDWVITEVAIDGWLMGGGGVCWRGPWAAL